MTLPFHLVSDVAMLEHWLARSETEPVIFFNYDRCCGGNVAAYRQVAGLAIPVALIDVTRAHEVKRALADRTGVRHESPQVIVVRAGRAVWSASHGAITGARVRQAVAGAAEPPPAYPVARPDGMRDRPWYTSWRPRGGSDG